MNTTQRKSALYGIPVFLPFMAMLFSKEVSWTLSDFLTGGVLLFGSAGLIDLV